MKETILLYNIMQQELSDLYRSICKDQGIELKMISPEEYAVPIGFLAYGTEEQKAEYIKAPAKAAAGDSNNEVKAEGRTEGESQSKGCPEPMMVFGGFTGPRLTEILKVFRESGMKNISLKAMMTEHNAVWDSVTLYEQLADERDQFARMKEMS